MTAIKEQLLENTYKINVATDEVTKNIIHQTYIGVSVKVWKGISDRAKAMIRPIHAHNSRVAIRGQS